MFFRIKPIEEVNITVDYYTNALCKYLQKISHGLRKYTQKISHNIASIPLWTQPFFTHLQLEENFAT